MLMKLCSKIGKNAGRNRFILLAIVFGLCGHSPASEHRDRGYMYLSPVPGAEYVLPATDFILVRFETVNPNDIDNLDSFITVTGASSGNHPAQWTKIASDGRTVIFRISGDFSSNELVTVDLNPAKDPGASGTIDPYSYEFMTSGPMPAPPPPPPPPAPGSESPAGGQVLNAQAAPETEWETSPPADMTAAAENAAYEAEAEGPMILPNGVSVPGDFPAITITAQDPAGVGEGYIFIDYSGSPRYTMIMENSGAPVWYERGTAHRDFKVQRNGIITWTNFQGFDQNFNYLRSFGAVNGYNTDNHELKVLENGHYLLFGVRGQSVDMTRFVSRPSGNEYANVNETCLQEFTAEGDLILQWRAWDNHDIRLVQYWSYDDDPRTAGSIRFTHMNSVDVDNDGHLVVSNKRVSEVTKINRDTGEVIWRLGSGQHP
ncbi:MAG: aryl-sulfate sulfotransferase, partial [Planctomycetota bacterium]